MIEDFDHVASNYDQSFTDTLVGTYQRKLVLETLNKKVSSIESLNVLELNGGTGEDALFFAKNAKSITSTDISKNMVKEIAKKTKDYANAQAKVLDISKIGSLQSNEKFDLIFSNFGGFNCLEQSDIEIFFKEVKKKIHSEAHICVVVMPRFCVWESTYFLAKLNFRKAFRRRKRQGVLANVDGKMIKTYYYSTEDIKRLAPDYEIISSAPIGLSVPPSYLNPYFSNKPKKVEKYYEKDRTRLTSSRFSNLADHCFIYLKVK